MSDGCACCYLRFPLRMSGAKTWKRKCAGISRRRTKEKLKCWQDSRCLSLATSPFQSSIDVHGQAQYDAILHSQEQDAVFCSVMYRNLFIVDAQPQCSVEGSVSKFLLFSSYVGETLWKGLHERLKTSLKSQHEGCLPRAAGLQI